MSTIREGMWVRWLRSTNPDAPLARWRFLTDIQPLVFPRWTVTLVFEDGYAVPLHRDNLALADAEGPLWEVSETRPAEVPATSLAHIKRLAADAVQSVSAARAAASHEDALGLVARAMNLRGYAADLLSETPLRVEHPLFGAGVLQHVDEAGLGLVLFDDSDAADAVQLDLLEEGV